MTNKKLLQLKKRYIKEGYKKAQKKLVREYWEKQQQHFDYDSLFDFDDIRDNLVDLFMEQENIEWDYERYEDGYDEIREEISNYAYDFADDVITDIKRVIEKITFKKFNKWQKEAQSRIDYLTDYEE